MIEDKENIDDSLKEDVIENKNNTIHKGNWVNLLIYAGFIVVGIILYKAFKK